MKKMKLGTGIIKGKIASSQCNFTTSIEALGQLKEAGVEDEIIEAMLARQTAAQAPIKNAEPTNTSAGTLSEDKQTYVSQDGKSTFTVGKMVQVNVGTDTRHPGYFVYIKQYNGKIGRWLTDDIGLEPAYAGQTYVITQISLEKANLYDIWVKHPKKIAYLYFETNNKIKYKVAIDAALYSKEISALDYR
ncbi:hypothetical protein [Mucilaginibacter sp. AK015]|uniref:hypothetical protein n=1 Tax=Mucilaginibacter sp. AK015 TaxID=2723072 RepID=UPI0016207286|nr:hypothetical protein [Mucilaginibacter sp. AK015]MBB5397174.1 hypothetical protein [Mucilaginibacter sp. AK015]